MSVNPSPVSSPITPNRAFIRSKSDEQTPLVRIETTSMSPTTRNLNQRCCLFPNCTPERCAWGAISCIITTIFFGGGVMGLENGSQCETATGFGGAGCTLCCACTANWVCSDRIQRINEIS